MRKEEANRHRNDVGKALKIAAGLTMAGLGALGAKHLVSDELAGFIVRARCSASAYVKDCKGIRSVLAP